MATGLALINPITVTLRGQQHKLLPGEIITDPIVQGLVTEAGGYLVSKSTTVLAACAFARKAQGKGADAVTQAIIVLAGFAEQLMPLNTYSVLTTVTHGTPVAGAQQLITAVPQGDVASIIVSALGRVTKVGTSGSESLTDFYSIWFRVTASNPSGTVVIGGAPPGQGVPFLDASTSMADASVNVVGVGGNAMLTFGNGALIGSGAQVTWSIDVWPRVS